MPNFSIALTGLQADTVALNTIGDNLANLNTTAFKKQTTTFEDLFYQNVGVSGSGDPLQVGVGTRVSGTQSDFSQGSLSTTSSSTDMALSGQGFFLVQQGNNRALTRAGNFELDASGNLTTTSGESVMGYGATDGTVNLNGGLVALNLPLGTTEAASATTSIALKTTLNSSAATSTSFTSPVTVYDSLGDSHSLTITYTKTGSNTWDYAVSLPSGDATGTTANTTGTLTFNSSGQLTSPTGNVSGISFGGLSDGAADLNISMSLYDSSGNPLLSQTAASSATTATSQNGYAAGSYESFSVDGDGVVSAKFSNGRTTTVGQVAVATVANTNALTRDGSNDYTATDASGAIVVGVANTGGLGTLEDQSLEQSNVDISAEFSDLIVAQRAFEANSKTVTAFDSVTQQAINMIR